MALAHVAGADQADADATHTPLPPGPALDSTQLSPWPAVYLLKALLGM